MKLARTAAKQLPIARPVQMKLIWWFGTPTWCWKEKIAKDSFSDLSCKVWLGGSEDPHPKPLAEVTQPGREQVGWQPGPHLHLHAQGSLAVSSTWRQNWYWDCTFSSLAFSECLCLCSTYVLSLETKTPDPLLERVQPMEHTSYIILWWGNNLMPACMGVGRGACLE